MVAGAATRTAGFDRLRGSGRRYGAVVRDLEVWTPAAAFLAATLALWIAANAAGLPFFASSSWVRWDANQYIAIASHGYRLYPCPASYPPQSSCGDAGWFPAYPALLAPLFRLGLPRDTTAVLVSSGFAFATLVLLWNGFLRGRRTLGSYLALFLTAFVPGAVYGRAAFPMSLTAFLVLLCLFMLKRERPWGAALAAAGAAACYPTAVLTAPLVAAYVLLSRGQVPTRQRIARAVAVFLIAVSGLLAALGVMWIQTGAWNAYFEVQGKYRHGFHDPFAALLSNVRMAWGHPLDLAAIPAIESAFVGALVLTVFVTAALAARRRTVSRFEGFALVCLLVLWLGPLTQANVNLYRGDLVLLPIAAILIPRVPKPVASLAFVASGTLCALIAYAFFRGLIW